MPGSAVALHRRARPVGGQGERRSAGELIAPVAQLRLHVRAGEPGPLPLRVIQVRERNRLQVGLPIRREGPVEGHQVIEDEREGPAVGDDVVQRHEHDVRVLCQLHEGAAQQRPVLQVEGPGGLLAHQGIEVSALEIHLCDGERVHGQHFLHGFAVTQWEPRPQRAVPLPQRRHGLAERRGIEGAVEPERHRHVVERAVLGEAVQEVEPALREGQRHRHGGIHRDEAGPRGRAAKRLDPRREIAHGLRLKEHRERQVDVERLAQPGHRLHRQQRMAAEFEERHVVRHRGHAPGRRTRPARWSAPASRPAPACPAQRLRRPPDGEARAGPPSRWRRAGARP